MTSQIIMINPLTITPLMKNIQSPLSLFVEKYLLIRHNVFPLCIALLKSLNIVLVTIGYFDIVIDCYKTGHKREVNFCVTHVLFIYQTIYPTMKCLVVKYSRRDTNHTVLSCFL